MRTPIAKEPVQISINELTEENVSVWNAEATTNYEASMPPCPNCGRTFSGADRLEVHLKGCKPDSNIKKRVSRRIEMNMEQV